MEDKSLENRGRRESRVSDAPADGVRRRSGSLIWWRRTLPVQSVIFEVVAALEHAELEEPAVGRCLGRPLTSTHAGIAVVEQFDLRMP
jgi:hypothetical protein